MMARDKLGLHALIYPLEPNVVPNVLDQRYIYTRWFSPSFVFVIEGNGFPRIPLVCAWVKYPEFGSTTYVLRSSTAILQVHLGRTAFRKLNVCGAGKPSKNNGSRRETKPHARCQGRSTNNRAHAALYKKPQTAVLSLY
jgi:hypothetical protein